MSRSPLLCVVDGDGPGHVRSGFRPGSGMELERNALRLVGWNICLRATFASPTSTVPFLDAQLVDGGTWNC
jgi:hypothetical protein